MHRIDLTGISIYLKIPDNYITSARIKVAKNSKDADDMHELLDMLGLSMICLFCRNSKHDSCPGGTWCDCQHKEVINAKEERSSSEEVGSPVRDQA